MNHQSNVKMFTKMECYDSYQYKQGSSRIQNLKEKKIRESF